MSYIFHSEAETEGFAADFAKKMRAGDIICLTGELGAGKTVFTRGLARGLGYGGCVTSPTFALMNVYEGGRLTVYHFDLYRLGDAADLESVGCEEYFDAGGVCVIEWPQRAQQLVPPGAVWIYLAPDKNVHENVRELVIHENPCH